MDDLSFGVEINVSQSKVFLQPQAFPNPAPSSKSLLREHVESDCRLAGGWVSYLPCGPQALSPVSALVRQVLQSVTRWPMSLVVAR